MKPHSNNRLITQLPKVGIRPTIDGRYGGVRESLEEFTLAMADSVAKLIQKNLQHACGDEVECVIPNFCIGGFAEAAQCENLFAREGVGVSLTVSPCWCYGSETIDLDPVRPKAIWGFNGTDRPGAVYLAAALSAHAQKGVPSFGIYGKDVQDLGDLNIPADVATKILRFVKAGVAVATMRKTAYLSIGSVSMGIAGSMVNQSLFQDYFGMRVESVDMAEVAGRIQENQFDQNEFKKALAWTKANCHEGADPNKKPRSRSEKDLDWETSVKMTLIARDLMIGNPALAEMELKEQSRGHNALVAGFQGQRHWTDHFPNGDFMEAILCSSFDWNGIRQPFVFATENDSLNGISMLLGHLLTGSAQLFADVRTYWSPDAVKRLCKDEFKNLPETASNGFLHLINSGPAALDWTGDQQENGTPTVKPWHKIKQNEVEKCLSAARWCASDLGYFPKGGWSTDFTTRGGIKCTMFRLNLVAGLGPVLQIAEGRTLDLPAKIHEKLDSRTSPAWPSTWFVPRLTGEGAFRDVYSVMNSWGANHCAISAGHIGAELISLASILRIPVDMHNLTESDIFRPSVWNRFGGSEKTGADFRACKEFGPLYR